MAPFARFHDRGQAGRELAEALSRLEGAAAVVYGLPRGGVPVAVEVARRLHAPLDLLIVRKIGHPVQPEYAIGALTDEGEVFLNEDEAAAVDPRWLAREKEREIAEARRRREAYLQGRPPEDVRGKTAVIVDDGLATGSTMRVAIRALRRRGPARIVVGVPVAPPDTIAALESEADEVVVVHVPEGIFGGIGAWYDEFSQLSDEEILASLAETREP